MGEVAPPTLFVHTATDKRPEDFICMHASLNWLIRKSLVFQGNCN